MKKKKMLLTIVRVEWVQWGEQRHNWAITSWEEEKEEGGGETTTENCVSPPTHRF